MFLRNHSLLSRNSIALGMAVVLARKTPKIAQNKSRDRSRKRRLIDYDFCPKVYSMDIRTNGATQM